jgi:LPXTG-motif cell wall-anchored protein
MSVGLPDFLTELLEGLRGPFSPVTAAGPGGTTTLAKTVLHVPEGITAPYVPGQLKRAGAIADQSSGTKRSTIMRTTDPPRAQTPTSASPATSTGATSTDPATGVDYGDPATDGTSVALPAAPADTGPSPVLLIGLAAIAGLGVWFFARKKR